MLLRPALYSVFGYLLEDRGRVKSAAWHSDDLEVYYRVNSVAIDTPERLIKRGGKFTATFTCEPYVYYDDDEIELSNIFYNSCLISIKLRKSLLNQIPYLASLL